MPSHEQLCHQFSIDEIKRATNDFGDELIIGKGGFGSVYLGVINNGTKFVAVKRLSTKSSQGDTEFSREIETLSKLRHRNLVRLEGYCNEANEKILVYEFMSNGTLVDHLYKKQGCVADSEDSQPYHLTWEERLNISIGAAEGLDFLHSGVVPRVIHRDIKDSNILINSNLRAKIADFGLAKLVKLTSDPQITSVSTTLVKGTFGYLDPEYFYTQTLTTKTDVYAFGVVLLVILSGRPAVDNSAVEDQRSLSEWAAKCIAKKRLDLIIDPCLAGKISSKSLKQFVEIVQKCLCRESKQRPTMKEVVGGLQLALSKQPTSGTSSRQPGGRSSLTQMAIAKLRYPGAQTIEEGGGFLEMSKVVYEGWMVRYGRSKIGRSYIHMRYFVLENRLLAYHKTKPRENVVPIKTLLIDGNCRVEDCGLKMHHGHMVYVLSVYNKKEIYHQITMAAFNIQEALIWKEKIESVIDQLIFLQYQESQAANGNKYHSFEYKSGVDGERKSSSSDHESQFSASEDEDNCQPSLMRRTIMGNEPPESVLDWTKESDSDLSNKNHQSFKYWRLLQCQNGLDIFEELQEVDFLPKSCSKAMKAVGVVDASCEEIFQLVMSMDATRYEWDCSFQYGSLVEEVDGHTAILYHRLQLDWFPMLVWPRDLCYLRYWRRHDDGSYVVLFQSREHEKCGPQPGFVRAHLESGGYNISPLKPFNGRPRTQVQHCMQIDLNGWGVKYATSFQQHCLLQMLNGVAGLRGYFSHSDDRTVTPRIPVMDEYSDDDDDFSSG